MKPWERWTFGLLSLAVAVTGFAYFWMKYFIVSDDPFAVVNHPWQAAMLHLHVIASPLLILVFGIIFNSHVMRKLRASQLPNRRSGYTSLATFALMLASGYLLQVSSSDAWLRALVALHVGSGVVFTVSYGAHLVISAGFLRGRQGTAVREVA